MNELVGRKLLAVERLSWIDRDGSVDARVGPTHLQFDGGRGIFLSGETDFTLGVRLTRAGDESWLVPYQYEFDGGHWAMRDSFNDLPFLGLRGARLKSFESVTNEMGEQVGLSLGFDLGTVAFHLEEGEVTI